jgi:hypothetical protein
MAEYPSANDNPLKLIFLDLKSIISYRENLFLQMIWCTSIADVLCGERKWVITDDHGLLILTKNHAIISF